MVELIKSVSHKILELLEQFADSKLTDSTSIIYIYSIPYILLYCTPLQLIKNVTGFVKTRLNAASKVF